jgi:hypothetical protein
MLGPLETALRGEKNTDSALTRRCPAIFSSTPQ